MKILSHRFKWIWLIDIGYSKLIIYLVLRSNYKKIYKNLLVISRMIYNYTTWSIPLLVDWYLMAHECYASEFRTECNVYWRFLDLPYTRRSYLDILHYSIYNKYPIDWFFFFRMNALNCTFIYLIRKSYIFFRSTRYKNYNY